MLDQGKWGGTLCNGVTTDRASLSVDALPKESYHIKPLALSLDRVGKTPSGLDQRGGCVHLTAYDRVLLTKLSLGGV